MNSAFQGEKALAESNCPQAIYHYTHALTEHPRAPHYFIQRSTAFSRLKPADGGPNYSAALRDAEIALSLARERGKRELILAAQIRRAVALYQLERFGDAAFVFGTVEAKMGGENKTDQDKSEGVKAAMANSSAGGKKTGAGSELPIWMAKVRRKLVELGDSDTKAVVSVVEYPGDIRVPMEKQLKAEWEALRSGKTVDETAAASNASTKTASEQPVTSANQTGASRSNAPVSTTIVSEKIRHEWYQSQDKVAVTLYVKGIAKDSVEVDLQETSASLQFPLASGSEYAFTLDPLYAPIDASASKVSVMSTKIEISLQKQAPGQKWGALEGSSSTTTTKIADRPAVPSGSGGSSTAASGPTYPTSSRHGVKDWDKVASSLTEKKGKGKGRAKDKKDGDEGESDGAESVDSEFGGDAVDGFFKKLYANADPDTRRAMVKSYVESQGTSLSTNWQEVGKGKMEVRPPT